MKLKNRLDLGSNSTTEKNEYNADSIQVLDGLSAIRKRVSLYLGSSDSEAVFHMWKEIFDNSADEHSAGCNDYIKIIIGKDNDIIMADRGRGIPVDVKSQTGNPIIIDVLTKLHSGGKFGSKAYANGTIGVHGVGQKATNALSTQFQVWSFRSGKWHHVEFQKGKLTKNLNTKTPIPKEMSAIKAGTIVRFSTDFSCFDTGAKLSIKRVKEYCELQAFLHFGLKIDLQTPKNTYQFYEKEGLKALLIKQLAKLGEESIGKPFVFHNEYINIALSWSKNSGESIQSYVSGSLTKEGGTHVSGLNDAIRDALKPYKGKFDFTPAEARDGLVGTMNVAVQQPKFSSQAKERLTNDDTTKVVYEILKPAFEEYFKVNKGLTKVIVQRAADLHKSYAKFTADRKSIAALKSKTAKALLSSKLAKAKTKDFKRIELFLVEGDSAGGTAKQARDKEFQAVLALRGKILNAFRSTPDKLFNNEEIQNICLSIGFELDAKNPIDKLRVGKIILLADPDVDGSHITNLMLSFFQKAFPETFANGHVYTCDTPLFYCQRSNGEKIFGSSFKDVKGKMDAKGYKLPPEGVQRIKGYGEIEPDTMQMVAFDAKTRKLTRMVATTGKDTIKFAQLVSQDTSARQELLGV